MSELKPCPFCKSTDVEQDYGSSFVVCNGCKAAAKASLWNTRNNDQCLQAAVEAVEGVFEDMRKGKNHIGLGDIRLTIGDQEIVIKAIKEALSE